MLGRGEATIRDEQSEDKSFLGGEQIEEMQDVALVSRYKMVKKRGGLM